MSLTLYFHPLASYCWKVLIALYENDTAFTPKLVDLGDPSGAREFRALWPLGKFPVLRDHDSERLIGESSIIIEYLALFRPGPVELIPRDPKLALEARFHDRFYDLYVHDPMQTLVFDKLRPPEQRNPLAVEQARAELAQSYSLIEHTMQTHRWAAGDTFTLADCAAAPALHYANQLAPIPSALSQTQAYLARLRARPSFARTLREAGPYLHLFPG
jgi:glutathione S-transferase